MSHIDQGPLPAYNSLTDNHLSGYFSNSRMRKQLRKSGLITKQGEIVTENTYRLNMGRKEHKKHVKDMLAQAIVHKTLDLERARQAEIRKKLEEIAKIELVRRVRSDRHKINDDAVLPFLSGNPHKRQTKRSGKVSSSQSASPPRVRQNKKETNELKKSESVVHEKTSRDRKRENCVLPLVSPRQDSCQSSTTSASSARPKTRQRVSKSAGSPQRKGKRPISALSSNYDDDNETVVYLDDEGRPISPSHIDSGDMKYSSRDPIDTRHLYSLDTAALRKYAMLMAKMEQGRAGMASPYLIPQVPLPPKSPRSGRAPLSAHRYRSGSGGRSPKRPLTAGHGQAYLHPSSSPKQVRGQQETMCEVYMEYHGSSLSLVREQFDKRQEVIVEQQHCGGNTLTVFRDKMEAGTKFSFISYRHRGYPFSLSIYIDGKMDCRVSVCCEYRHAKGGRIGGKKGHFSISSIAGAVPCYKCQVEKGIRVKSAAPRRKLKRPPNTMEEVTVVETQLDKEEPEERSEIIEDHSEEILVPVDDEDEKKTGQTKAEADYDDDFDSDSSSESEKAGYVYKDIQNNERGSDDDEDDDRRSLKDAENVIKVANRIVQESAISVEKERKYNNEQPRGKTDNDDDEENSYSDDFEDKEGYSTISSIGEDEDYFQYKKRMMKKIKEQEKKKSKPKKSEVKTSDVNKKKDNQVEVKEDGVKNGKKMSSTTSSALGQAEPVEDGPGDDTKKKRKTKKNGKRQAKGNADSGSGSDTRDTADEVSEIESEMAASPRKVEAEINLAGPELDEKKSGAEKIQGSEEGKGKSHKGSESLKEDLLNRVKEESVSSGSKLNTNVGKEGGKVGKLENNKQLIKIECSVDMEKADKVDLVGHGPGFHVDIYPKESLQRGEGDFEERPCEDDNKRGGSVEDGQTKQRSSKGQCDGSDDGSCHVMRGDKRNHDKDTGKETPVKKRSKHRLKVLKDELTQKQIPQDQIDPDSYIDAGAGFVDGSDRTKTKGGKSNVQSQGSHFESETMVFAMVKTGENQHLIEQKQEEEVQRRLRSESSHNREEEEDKRKGRCFKDLSPKMQVIRGFVGDDGSEGDDDDELTYLKLNLQDGRADTSDSDVDALGEKDYVLANSHKSKASKGSRKHISFGGTDHFDDEPEDKPNYRVLFNVEHEGNKEKTKIKAMIQKKKMKEIEEKKVQVMEDVRGDGDASQHQTGDHGNEVNSIEVEVHHPQLMTRVELDADSDKSVHKKRRVDSTERFLQKEQEPLAHQHAFSEEPSNKVSIQAVPTSLEQINNNEAEIEKDAAAYSTDTDHSGSEDDNKKQQTKSNPETWYRVQDQGDILSEEFMGATEEIHHTKFVENEKERYAKHPLAFQNSPNVDNESMRNSGSVVSILRTQQPAEIMPEAAGILSLSVHTPGQRYDAPDVKSSSSNVKRDGPNDVVSKVEEESKEKDESQEQIKQRIPQQNETCIENAIADSFITKSSPFIKSNSENQNQNFSQETNSTKTGIESSKDSSNSLQGGAIVMVDGTLQSERQVDSEDEFKPDRRDSNYMADQSSGSFSESAGTKSSDQIITDGRTVRKKKKKSKKKPEEGGENIEAKSGKDDEGDELDGLIPDLTLKKSPVETFKKQQRKEARSNSVGSIPNVIITSAEEHGQKKDLSPEVDDEPEKNEAVDIDIGGDEKGNHDKAVNDSNVSSHKSKNLLAIGKKGSKARRVALEREEALCEDEGSSDDVSGIDALIEVLEDQLADSKQGRATPTAVSATGSDNISQNDQSESLDNSDSKNNNPGSDFDGRKSSPFEDGESVVHNPSGFEDKVETLVSHYNEDLSEEKDKGQFDGQGQRENSVDVTESESMEELQQQAMAYVSQLMASVQNMEQIGTHGSCEQEISTGDGNSLKPDNEKVSDLAEKLDSPESNGDAKYENTEHVGLDCKFVGEAKTDGDNEPSPSSPSTPSGRKSSLTTHLDEDHIERRRKQKLTVSFVIEENEDLNKSIEKEEEEKDVCSWEDADESEKEEEYEKLEREIEKSLCGKR